VGIIEYSCTCHGVHAYANMRSWVLLRVSVNINKREGKINKREFKWALNIVKKDMHV
jgi:hypothetical protein